MFFFIAGGIDLCHCNVSDFKKRFIYLFIYFAKNRGVGLFIIFRKFTHLLHFNFFLLHVSLCF